MRLPLMLVALLSLHVQIAQAADDERSGNLLDGGRFEGDAETRAPLPPWQASQHSGPTSYTFEVEDGVLTIRRIDREPWGQVTHPFDFGPFRGQRLRWSVEAAGDLNEQWTARLERTGIGVLIFAQDDALSAFVGRNMLLTDYIPTPVQIGRFDWTRIEHEFEVPANAGRGEVSIRMTMGGQLKLRNPRLERVEPEADPPREDLPLREAEDKAVDALDER